MMKRDGLLTYSWNITSLSHQPRIPQELVASLPCITTDDTSLVLGRVHGEAGSTYSESLEIRECHRDRGGGIAARWT
jgi:hypothetical protein